VIERGKSGHPTKLKFFHDFFLVATFLPQNCLFVSIPVFTLKIRMQYLRGIPLVLGHEWTDLQSPALPLGYRA